MSKSDGGFVMNPSVLTSFHSAICRSPGLLFEGFEELRPVLLARSPLARNRPLFYQIANALVWMKERGSYEIPTSFPIFESDITASVRADFYKQNKSLINRIDLANPAHITFFLKEIGRDGIHILSGLRRTHGSDVTSFPPCTSDLYDSFELKHKDQPLTVGGRALSKHSVRDSNKFWGSACGTTNAMNAAARRCLDRIIVNAEWNNIFALPHGVKAYEVRLRQGYGARWEFKDGGISFRGFLEPAMKDGHEKKWRH